MTDTRNGDRRATAPLVRIRPACTADPGTLIDREWLVTNGLGGYASGSVLGIPTRRYHGLFVPSLSDPKGRFVTLPRIDELLEHAPGRWVNLGGAECADGRLVSEAPHHLHEFRLDGTLPVWTYDVAGRRIEKSIAMPHHQNTVCLRYRLLEGAPIAVRLRLYASNRRIDSMLERRGDWPFTMVLSGPHQALHMHGGALVVRLRMRADAPLFVADPSVENDVLYRVERDRGYDCVEQHYSPGWYAFTLSGEHEASFTATCEAREALTIEPSSVFAAERSRLEHLLRAAGPTIDDDVARQLVMHADQFIVRPGSREEETLLAASAGERVRSVIAGYHWFNDWGRDTMISLEGLALCTGRHAEARAILTTFAHYVKDGLIPNFFPEGEREAVYHTVDASFWYFHAIERYLAHTGDRGLLRELYPALRSIVEHHVAGTRFGIGMDPADALIREGAEGYQLTWMDAKVGDWVVTPRRGKPVEIQALWYNALRLMQAWSAELGEPSGDVALYADRARASFNARFWIDERRHLKDVIDGPHGDDASLRPNQVFAISLAHPILDDARWAPVLDTVRAALLTPFGLRTLSPDAPDYQRFYEGALRARDAAYHQGTVWPWLIGHYVDAWARTHGRARDARALLQQFPTHLLEAGMGSISEIFDAEPPHRPRGCIAQAWSVAEVLRAWIGTRADA